MNREAVARMRRFGALLLLLLSALATAHSAIAARNSIMPGEPAAVLGLRNLRGGAAGSQRRGLRTLLPVTTGTEQLSETESTTQPPALNETETVEIPTSDERATQITTTGELTTAPATAASVNESAAVATELLTDGSSVSQGATPTPLGTSGFAPAVDVNLNQLDDFQQTANATEAMMVAQPQNATTTPASISTELESAAKPSVDSTLPFPQSTADTSERNADRPTTSVLSPIKTPLETQSPVSSSPMTSFEPPLTSSAPPVPTADTPTPTPTTTPSQEATTTQVPPPTTFAPTTHEDTTPSSSSFTLSQLLQNSDSATTTQPTPTRTTSSATSSTAVPNVTPTPTASDDHPIGDTVTPTATPTLSAENESEVVTVRPDLGFLHQKSPWAALRPDAAEDITSDAAGDLWVPRAPHNGTSIIDARDNHIPVSGAGAAPTSAAEPIEPGPGSWRVPVVVLMVALIVGMSAFASYRWAWLPYQRRKRAKQYNELPVVAEGVSGGGAAADAVEEAETRRRGNGEKGTTPSKSRSKSERSRCADRMSCGSDLSFMSFDIETPPDTPSSKASTSSSGSHTSGRSTKRAHNSPRVGTSSSPAVPPPERRTPDGSAEKRAIPPPPRRPKPTSGGRKPPHARSSRYKPPQTTTIEE